MELSITGTISKIGDVQNIGQLKKQEFLIREEVDNPQYEQQIQFEVWNDKANIANHKVGDRVSVSFNVKSNEYKGKFYTNLRAWKIAAYVDNVSNAQQQPARQQAPEPATDDLPF